MDRQRLKDKRGSVLTGRIRTEGASVHNTVRKTGLKLLGVIMNKGVRNRLEGELRNMVNQLDETKAKQKQPIPQLGTGNIIRRRKGEKDKRFSVSVEIGSSAAATG